MNEIDLSKQVEVVRQILANIETMSLAVKAKTYTHAEILRSLLANDPTWTLAMSLVCAELAAKP